MADREKVIRALESCTAPVPCTGCPYNKTVTGCRDMKKDALELLRKQEPKKPLFIDGGRFACPDCEAVIMLGNPYCWSCGRAVKWDG